MTETVTQPGLAASLGLNPTLFIAQLINFGLVLFVVWKWVYHPLVKLMDERSKKIADGLANAEEAKQRLTEAHAEQESLLKQARQESKRLVDAARLEAERERQRLMAETQGELEKQLIDARERLKREKEATIMAVRREVGELVIQATQKVTSEAVDADAQHSLVAQAIGELEGA